MAGRKLILSVVSVLFLFSFLAPQFAAAVEWYPNCTGGKYWSNATVCVGASCLNLSESPITCPYGCADNGIMCNLANQTPDIFIIFSACLAVAVAIIIMFALARFDIGGMEGVLGDVFSAMFNLAGLIMLITATGITGAFFTMTPNAISAINAVGYTMFIIMLVLIIALMLMEYIRKHLRMVNKMKGKR